VSTAQHAPQSATQHAPRGATQSAPQEGATPSATQPIAGRPGSLFPQPEEFLALAKEHNVVPVWREMMADLETPVAAFAKLVGADGAGFLLESVEHGGRWGRFSFVGRNPAATLVVSRDNRGVATIRVSGALPDNVRLNEGILTAVEDLLSAYRAPKHPDLPPLFGGIVGYLGYDIIREIERLPNANDNDTGYPDSVLNVVGSIAAFDHWRHRVYLIENVFVTDDAESNMRAYHTAEQRIDAMANDLGKPLPYTLALPPDPLDPKPSTTCSMAQGEYQRAVEVAKEYILNGDIFQVVLAQRFDLDLEADPYDVYRVLRLVNPSPYMYLLQSPEISVVGSSPEPMVQLLDGKVISRPIAGTRRRGKSEAEDRILGAELREHPKEVAEHIMLVDLARNDVGRVVEFGTCHVEELMTLEHYSHVMHLTSQVTGTLRAGLGPIDVLRATFPAGTVSGAPKVRAMEIIDELEPSRRGPYAGVVGYLDFSGNLDTAIAIRTMWVGPNGRACVQAGAGVVADSDPKAEDDECAFKAAALLAAVPEARRMRLEKLRKAPPTVSGMST
jgi:anthranilate synthase component I